MKNTEQKKLIADKKILKMGEGLALEMMMFFYRPIGRKRTLFGGGIYKKNFQISF